MRIKIAKTVASNVSIDLYDVLQIKKSLNRLGLYVPLEATGITAIPDADMFKGIKNFQSAHHLPVTGEIRPDDATSVALSKEAAKTPSGFYIWRTVEDGKVRKNHAQYNRIVRSWSDSPDPGEDFNCRCWAQHIPVVNDQKDRIQSILDNTPAIFEIALNKDAVSKAPIYENVTLAKIALTKHEKTIEHYASKHHVDPDIVKAIMWAEHARGGQWGLGYVADAIHRSRTLMPMNVYADIWYTLVTNKKDDLYDYNTNIEAGTVLLGRIRNRIHHPTVAKIAAIWEYIGKEDTNDYAAYIETVYKNKPWQTKSKITK